MTPEKDLKMAGYVQTPVVAVFDQTDDIRTFRMARPKGFDFQAGQFLNVEVQTNGSRHARHYSISSAPESAYLEISVKRLGLVSRTMHSIVGVGSLLSVQPPEGRFVYPEGDERPLVLLAGGVGSTPLMSMLRHAVDSDPSRPVTFLLSARTAKDIPFHAELSALTRQHPQVRVGVTLTRESNRPGFRSGRIDEALLRRAAPDPANTLFYICGPTPMIEGMKRLLSGLGVPADQIRWEVFEAAVAGARAAMVAGPDAVEENTESDSAEGETPQAAHILQFPRKEMVQEILRFTRGEMMLHWAIAVPFLVCFTTGFVLKFFYNLHSEEVSRAFLSFLHRVAGGALAVFPILAVARNWRDYKKYVYNIKVGFAWTIDDLKWLFLVGPATVNKRVVLPEQRKFNAAERLNFMMVMLTYPIFIVTGVLLWLPGNHFAPWIIHIGIALVAPLLMFGHIYMAVVNPSTRVGLSGMITGQVDREWAKHHYARWYREHFEEDGTPIGISPSRADH